MSLLEGWSEQDVLDAAQNIRDRVNADILDDIIQASDVNDDIKDASTYWLDVVNRWIPD